MRQKSILMISAICILLCLSGCRGWRSEKPPTHPNPNLDWQANISPQEAPLIPPENTVIWGNEQSFSNKKTRKQYLKSNTVFYYGKTRKGNWVKRIPINVNRSLLLKGEDRYNIYCSACHTKTGNGLKSEISKRGWVVPNISTYPTTDKRDGELFHIVRNGIRTMPGYRKSLSEEESWAIVVYLRALQKTNKANYSELPESLKTRLKQGER